MRSLFYRLLRSTFAAGVFVAFASSASADPAVKNPAKAESGSAEEALAMEFVQQHHAELADLLKQLKTSDQTAWEKAVRELAATRKRLAELESRDSERYALELKVWKLNSRANLIAARYTMGGSEQKKAELRGALQELADARLETQRLTRDRLRARLADAESAVSRAESEKNDFVEKRMSQLLNARKRERAADRKEKSRASDGSKK